VLGGELGKASIVDAQALAQLHEPMMPHLPQFAMVGETADQRRREAIWRSEHQGNRMEIDAATGTERSLAPIAEIQGNTICMNPTSTTHLRVTAGAVRPSAPFPL